MSKQDRKNIRNSVRDDLRLLNCDRQQSYNFFPKMRLRRLRKNSAIRDLFQEVRLSSKDLVLPLFVQESLKNNQPIDSMPGVFRFAPNTIMHEIEESVSRGINAIILFGLPTKKDAFGKSSYDDKGVVQRTIKSIRDSFGDKIVIMTDVCLCQYTTHGHCGIIDEDDIHNDKTINTLAKTALSHAKAGADIVAPSAMMDGQVKKIRDLLDENGYSNTLIMGYSAKQASSFFSPFRDAAHSKPGFGNRQTYQMSYSNPREAGREIESDIEEGADVLMIKPALSNLDLIYEAKIKTLHPIAAYSVSGEYSMIKAAAINGWIDEDLAVIESITAIKRAGANIIISYYSKRMAEILNTN
ncbi:MAG TPA: porphobilinogen synthase [Candidatus Nitrosocosmicus sp.]|nr:porphobilinogen synthase [Candidatus Nitrosocosmicus sp.]